MLDGEEAERLLNTLVYSHVCRLVYTNAIVGGGDTGDRGERAREGAGDGQAPMPPAAPTQQTQQTQARREEREAREALMLREALMPAAAARDTILAGNWSCRGVRVGMAHVAAAFDHHQALHFEPRCLARHPPAPSHSLPIEAVARYLLHGQLQLN